MEQEGALSDVTGYTHRMTFRERSGGECLRAHHALWTLKNKAFTRYKRGEVVAGTFVRRKCLGHEAVMPGLDVILELTGGTVGRLSAFQVAMCGP